ncbi:hypothetical protein IC615_18810 [Serratia ureilytica]
MVMHGHPRDVAKTLQAAIDAAQGAGDNSLLVAPLFQVPETLAARCRSAGLQAPQEGTPCGTAAPGSKAVWIMAGKPARSTPWITCWPI